MGIQSSEVKWLDLSIGKIQFENGYGVCGRRGTEASRWEKMQPAMPGATKR
jgi:hypothetical protein